MRTMLPIPPPALRDVGDDLLRVTPLRRAATLASPLLAIGAYAWFAMEGWWSLAVLAVMALSFLSYGSSSHDLVHRTLGLPRAVNDMLLSIIEFLCFRSGTAYRLSHLNHHRHLLEPDDVEGRYAFGSWIGAVIAGPLAQGRLWLWAWARYPAMRRRLLSEAIGILALLAACLLAWRWTIAPAVYAGLVIAGSWAFPLMTVYVPHDSRGQNALTRTRLFRGWWFRVFFADHLYHLEHHLYPGVPHHHWKILADRLDPYFRSEGIRG